MYLNHNLIVNFLLIENETPAAWEQNNGFSNVAYMC